MTLRSNRSSLIRTLLRTAWIALITLDNERDHARRSDGAERPVAELIEREPGDVLGCAR